MPSNSTASMGKCIGSYTGGEPPPIILLLLQLLVKTVLLVAQSFLLRFHFLSLLLILDLIIHNPLIHLSFFIHFLPSSSFGPDSAASSVLLEVESNFSLLLFDIIRESGFVRNSGIVSYILTYNNRSHELSE